MVFPKYFQIGFFIVLLFCFSYGDDSGSFADALFETRDYLRATGEYKRQLFFSSDTSHAHFYAFRIAECYRKRKQYSTARILYDRIIVQGEIEGDLERKVIIGLSKCSINAGEIELSRLLLDEFIAKHDRSDSVSYLLGIGYVKERNWEHAELELSKITDHVLKEQAMDLLTETSKKRFKDPKTALILSMFIPGAGQVYTSNYVKGFISFALNATLGYLMYRAGSDGRKMDAFLIAYFGMQRFYFGNLEQARKFSLEHNEKILDRIVVE